MRPKRKSPFDRLRFLLLQYFVFTMPERKGIIVLICLQFLLLLILLYLKFTTPHPTTDFSILNTTVEKYNALLELSNRKDSIPPVTIQIDSTEIIHRDLVPFRFNPNKLADSLWARLGLSQRQIQVIKKYENKGGTFRSKADIKKMYCISDAEYNRLESYIDLPEEKPRFHSDSSRSAFTHAEQEQKAAEASPMEINIANEEDLIAIPGIGPGRASAIIKYRDKLGGYVELEQVKEAYGMDSIYDAVKKYFLLNIYTTRRININTYSLIDLKHPYISNNLAQIIINYRKVHGDYQEVSDLKKLEMVEEGLYKKLAPYLKVK